MVERRALATYIGGVHRVKFKEGEEISTLYIKSISGTSGIPTYK
jgi:hypothetical protein